MRRVTRGYWSASKPLDATNEGFDELMRMKASLAYVRRTPDTATVKLVQLRGASASSWIRDAALLFRSLVQELLKSTLAASFGMQETPPPAARHLPDRASEIAVHRPSFPLSRPLPSPPLLSSSLLLFRLRACSTLGRRRFAQRTVGSWTVSRPLTVSCSTFTSGQSVWELTGKLCRLSLNQPVFISRALVCAFE